MLTQNFSKESLQSKGTTQLDILVAIEATKVRPHSEPMLYWLTRYEEFLLSEPYSRERSLALDGLVALFDVMGLTYVTGVGHE